jgi:1,4-dihydroxy-2-naphthoyl-CoA hydrolase
MSGAPSDLEHLLGLRYPQVTPDRVEVEWDVPPALEQPSGPLHRGMHCAAIEAAASVGAAAWLGDRGTVVGVSNHTDFLHPVRSRTVRAVATPIHRGRSQQLWLVEVREAGGQLLARGQVRLQNAVPAGGPVE